MAPTLAVGGAVRPGEKAQLHRVKSFLSRALHSGCVDFRHDKERAKDFDMTRFHSGLRPLAAALLCSTALWGAVAAHAAESQPVYNPPIYMAHGIEYMSGGIGSDEAQLMETVLPRWPAAFEFSVKDHKGADDFAASVHITVRDNSGIALLDHVASGGPFMVARLDPGNYEVEAQLGSQTLKQELHVMPGTSTKATFVWPAGTDMAAAGTHSVQ
jgi:hypothetical protein